MDERRMTTRQKCRRMDESRMDKKSDGQVRDKSWMDKDKNRVEDWKKVGWTNRQK